MFIGREKELESLQTIYEKDGFGMTVIYGRRRVGKSFLISEFIKGKKAIFYTATKVGAERNLEHGILGEFGSFITEVGTWWGVEQMIDANGE